MKKRKRIDSRMPCRYILEKDLIDRLNGCTFLLDGIPVVVEWAGDENLTVFDITMGQVITKIRADDPRLDISSLELGYMNSPQRVYYIFRDPIKKYQQGVSPNNTRVSSIDGTPLDMHVFFGFDSRRYSFVRSKEFADSIMGNFPTIENFFQSEHIKEAAISQEIALQRSELGLIFVYHRCVKIGYIEGGSIVIPNRKTSWVTQKILERNDINLNVKVQK